VPPVTGTVNRCMSAVTGMDADSARVKVMLL
jgi:hypothetical protein